MNPKLPSRIMVIGALAFSISLAVKMFPALAVIGRSPVFEWACSIVTALAFSTGMFLSLCGLVTEPTRRRTFFALHLIGLLVMCGLLTLYFEGYAVLTHVFEGMDAPQVLPGLVEEAQSANSEAMRLSMARDAYRIYGLNVTYRRDDGALANYQPTADDQTARARYAQEAVATADARQSLEDDLLQFPRIFGLYLGSFFLVYFAGTLWLLLKKPGDRP
jgi:hypothetical protein